MIQYDICVVGMGYIGLPTALLFAKSGKKVLGYDISEKVVEKINNCQTGINEPGLNELLNESINNGRLKADTKIDYADVYIISVPTPFKEGRKPDMTYVQTAVDNILPYIKKGCSIVLESTSPVGTTEEYICKPLIEKGFTPGEDVFVAYSPERVLPGNILNELICNDRILGGISEKSEKHISKLYKLFVKGDINVTNAKTAEACKLMENAYRDVNIAFANEMAKMCEKAGINAWEVQALCNNHPRVDILTPGPGVGGHCIAVDPWFLVNQFPNQTTMIKNGRQINDSMPEYTVKRIKDIIPGSQKKIAVLGITYKPNVDDTRESPIIKIIGNLKSEGYKVSIHDPYVKNLEYGNESLLECVKDADMLLLGVNHDVFKNIDLKKVYELMRNKIILDTRNFINKKEAEKQGFIYFLLGSG